MKARTELISVRLTPEEKRRMEYCAEMMGITQTELIVRGINHYYDSVREAMKKLNK
jgi:predicted DNA-binding protein